MISDSPLKRDRDGTWLHPFSTNQGELILYNPNINEYEQIQSMIRTLNLGEVQFTFVRKVDSINKDSRCKSLDGDLEILYKWYIILYFLAGIKQLRYTVDEVLGPRRRTRRKELWHLLFQGC